MVIHACIFSQALFSTELHWRTKLYASAITSEHLSCSLLTSAELSLSHSWLYSALTRYDSSSALFDATPACPHTLSGPVLHTYVSDSSTQSPDALFSIVLKPPAGVFRPPTGVFSTTDRLPTGYRPATDRLPPATAGYRPTGYRRLPTGYHRLLPATDRLPPATAGYRMATAGYQPATADYRRLPSATDRLSSATAGYRPATAGRRLPTGYRRLPPTTAGCRRLPTGYSPATAGSKKKKKKKKKKKNSFCRLRNATRALYKQSSRFGDWEMPIVPKKFSGHVLQNEDCMCVSLYIYGH